MNAPSFIIGGTAAGGTSFLYELLIQHKEIYLPKERIPEPHYYYKSWEYQKGLQWYLQTYFLEAIKGQKLGERSSSYLYGGEEVASKIAKDFPSMKFIFMLRNPIERTFANYRFTVLQGFEDLSFKEALMQEKKRVAESQGIWKEIQPYDYTGRGFYAKQLQAFLKYFPKENILCVQSESLSNQNMDILPKIYQFLGLEDTTFIPKPAPSHTSFSVVDAKLQKQLREHFGDSFSMMMNCVRREEEITDGADQKQFLQLKNNLKMIKEEMPEDCREMLSDIFYQDIISLQQIFNLNEWTDFDIASWLRRRGGGKIMS